MQSIAFLITEYLSACEHQKKLSPKTLKAYRIDLRQFQEYVCLRGLSLSRESVTAYIADMHRRLKPKSVKRKIATLKAFCHYLQEEALLEDDPFQRVHLKFQEPFTLPRTIPLRTIERLLTEAHRELQQHPAGSARKIALRDICVLELLFATGMRVSELCGLNLQDIDLAEGDIWVFGKGAKERHIQIGSPAVLLLLQQYYEAFADDITEAFFLNRQSRRLSEQSVRAIIRKYCDAADIEMHITPHMFRHSFATLLLEEDVDIRYIQRFLGHSSITTTQIYTHVATAKQRDILVKKHPRNRMSL